MDPSADHFSVKQSSTPSKGSTVERRRAVGADKTQQFIGETTRRLLGLKALEGQCPYQVSEFTGLGR